MKTILQAWRESYEQMKKDYADKYPYVQQVLNDVCEFDLRYAYAPNYEQWFGNVGKESTLSFDGLFYTDLWQQQCAQMQLWALDDLRKDFEAEVQIAAASNSAVRGKDFSVDTHGEYVCVDVRAILVMWCAGKGMEL